MNKIRIISNSENGIENTLDYVSPIAELEISHHFWLTGQGMDTKSLGLDDAKISLVRNRGLKRYQQLESDQAKAELRKQVNDSLILIRAFSQGLEIGHTIEMDEADDVRRNQIKAADAKYQPKKQPKPEEKGVAAKVERLGINFADLVATLKKG